MALTTMYPAKPNSPQTTLTADITAAATSMTVADASVLPSAPNLCTIGEDENAEVVLYSAISGNVVSGLIRGQSGTVASVWEAGTVIARDFTSYDHDTFKSNIEDLNATKAPIASPALTGTPTAPTASAGDNSTKIATTAFVNGVLLNIGQISEATFTSNAYVSSGHLYYSQIGKLVFVSVEYTMAQNIVSSSSNIFSGYPTPIGSYNFTDFNVTDEAPVSSGSLRLSTNPVNTGIRGAHTGGYTYRASGVYIAA